MTATTEARLIESDDFPFEFLSHLAERESWRKEIHRPIYHVHKWWAKRLQAANSSGKRLLVFAAAKFMSQRELTERGVEFCQLPYAIHRILGD